MPGWGGGSWANGSIRRRADRRACRAALARGAARTDAKGGTNVGRHPETGRAAKSAPADAPATVSVSGRGSVTATPDTASVAVGVATVQPTVGLAQTEAATEMRRVVAAIRGHGIAAADIQTSHYQIWPVQDRDRDGNLTEIRGYQVSNQVTVTVRQ